MLRCLAACLLLVLSPTATVAQKPIGEEQVKRTALEFGRALVDGDASALRSALPSRGKVRLRLIHLGPEQGSFSSNQVQAVLKNFLREGAVKSFDLLRVECASEQYAMVHARAKVADRDGRRTEIDLHLSFQPDGDRWVLEQIRETPP